MTGHEVIVPWSRHDAKNVWIRPAAAVSGSSETPAVHPVRKEKSELGALWVSHPIDTTSTPVSA
ncbi:hypothetical protein C5B89_15885 [Haloferax sp. Atlit-47N]|nr:hypothetical protein C5B88_10180 [Haloferax sp. Atlit-24N]RDZ36410.1 hypothetical protein C5B89_15885 [Haloferax sp. Atlit-47N]RLM35209.1 hypothetical protein DVK03_10190 [Haloferax sp. Atlit-109R]RLM43057.1 hypothetical protein DVK04_10205 [Haloferax sp. Atlit-105R]